MVVVFVLVVMVEWMEGWMDGWMDRWMDGWMGGRMGGWTDGNGLHGLVIILPFGGVNTGLQPITSISLLDRIINYTDQ